MDTQILQRAAALTVWSRERGREPSQVTGPNGTRYDYQDIKVQNGTLQAIDPDSEDIIKARLGGSSFDIEVGTEDRPLYVSDTGSSNDGLKLYLVEDRYNRVNYHALVGYNEVKLINQRSKQETSYSIY